MWRVVMSLFVLLVSCMVVRAELPPEILADKHLIKAERLRAMEDYAAAFEMVQKIIALQREHNLDLPHEFHFRHARIAFFADSTQIAHEAVSKYLSITGKEGEFYSDALALLLDLEDSRISAEEICTGKPTGASCWKELANHPRCYVWDNHYYEDQAVTWSGKCAGGKANGEGTLIWARGDEKHSETGRLAKGKKQGRWVVRGDRGTSEGLFVNGNRQGHWVLRSSYGEVSEGAYVDGKKQGNWKYHDGDGRQSEGIYMDGRKHGQWVFRDWSRAVLYQSYADGYEDGEFHGEYELCSQSEGSTPVSVRGKYAVGKKQGYWHNDNSYDGKTAGGRWIGSGHYDENGQRQGSWTLRLFYCSGYEGTKRRGRYEGDFVDGKKNGRWIFYVFPAYPRLGMCYFKRFDQGKQIESEKKKIETCRGWIGE